MRLFECMFETRRLPWSGLWVYIRNQPSKGRAGLSTNRQARLT